MPVMTKRKVFVEYFAEAGGITQEELARIADLHQTTISRVIRGLPVARQTAYQALIALNKVRADRDLEPVQFDDILW